MIVPVTEKSIVSPSNALTSAPRNEPAPLSFVLVTVIVVALTLCRLVRAAQSNVIRKKVRVFIGTVMSNPYACYTFLAFYQAFLARSPALIRLLRLEGLSASANESLQFRKHFFFAHNETLSVAEQEKMQSADYVPLTRE